MLLMGAESQMILLQPDGYKFSYASVETGKVISEWEATLFSKNGVDIPMRVSALLLHADGFSACKGPSAIKQEQSFAVFAQ